jgi:hypothetical protein
LQASVAELKEALDKEAQGLAERSAIRAAQESDAALCAIPFGDSDEGYSVLAILF